MENESMISEVSERLEPAVNASEPQDSFHCRVSMAAH
jgi:hypothetical protein